MHPMLQNLYPSVGGEGQVDILVVHFHINLLLRKLEIKTRDYSCRLCDVIISLSLPSVKWVQDSSLDLALKSQRGTL